MTLVRMVMAPTAISPPYRSREELKQTKMTLSLACIIKGDSPRARQGSRILALRRRFLCFTFSRVFLPQRKAITQVQETPWEMTVARAAPFTPMPRAKMKMGSRMMLHMAPMSTVSILVLAKPWAVM